MEAARTSTTRIEMMIKIGLTPRGRTYGSLKPHIERLKIDLSHMRHGGIRVDPDSVFVKNSTAAPATVRRLVLRDRLISYTCSGDGCGNTGTHLGKPLTLQLDHRNGDCRDHRIQNLRWLCPNCHSQTETYSRDSKGTRRRLNSSKAMVTLCCHHCNSPFQRPKREMYLRDGYRYFCTRGCSTEFRNKNRPENSKHKEIYEAYQRIQTYLGTGKLYGISGNMVKKIVIKYRRVA